MFVPTPIHSFHQEYKYMWWLVSQGMLSNPGEILYRFTGYSNETMQVLLLKGM